MQPRGIFVMLGRFDHITPSLKKSSLVTYNLQNLIYNPTPYVNFKEYFFRTLRTKDYLKYNLRSSSDEHLLEHTKKKE